MTAKKTPEPVAPLWAQVGGWYGALAILAAYVLVSMQIITADNVWYQLLNLTGAGGLLIVTWYEKVYQNVALNLIWIGVALYALFKLFSS